MTNTGSKIINTGLKGQIAKDVLNSVIGQMSDGIWENSRIMQHYWKFVAIEDIDGDICIVVNNSPYIFEPYRRTYNSRVQTRSFDNYFVSKCHRDDIKIKQFFANKIKQIVREDFNDHNKCGCIFNDKDNSELHYISSYSKDENGNYPSITVADAYKVYITLK